MEKKAEPLEFSRKKTEAISFFKEHYLVYATLSILICSAVGYFVEYRVLNRFGLNISSFAEIDDFLLAGLKIPELLIVSAIFPFFIVPLINSLVSTSGILNRLSTFDFEKHKEIFQQEINEQKNRFQEIDSQYKSTSELIESSHFPVKYLINFFLLLNKKRNIHKQMQIIKKEKENINKANEEGLKTANKGIEEKKSILREIRKIQLEIVISFAIIFLIIYLVQEYKVLQELDRIIQNPTTMATVQLRNKITISSTPTQPLVFITATNKFMFFYQHETDEKKSTFAIPISSILNVYYSEFKKETSK